MNGSGYGIKSHNTLMSPAASQMYHASTQRVSKANSGSVARNKYSLCTGLANMNALSVDHT